MSISKIVLYEKYVRFYSLASISIHLGFTMSFFEGPFISFIITNTHVEASVIPSTVSGPNVPLTPLP